MCSQQKKVFDFCFRNTPLRGDGGGSGLEQETFQTNTPSKLSSFRPRNTPFPLHSSFVLRLERLALVAADRFCLLGDLVNLLFKNDFDDLKSTPTLQLSHKKTSVYGGQHSIPVLGIFDALLDHVNTRVIACVPWQ